MFISKGFKALGGAIVPILVFSQVAMAAPATITWQNAPGQYASVSYLNALATAPMKTALTADLSANELANLPIFVTDSNGSAIDYAAAINKPETYAAALTDSTVNNAKVPAATYQMNADGTLSTIVPVVTVASVSAVNSTIAVGGTTGFTFMDSTGAATVPTGVTYSVIGSNASTGSVTNGVFTATAGGSYTIQATIGSVILTTGVTVTAAPAALAMSSVSAINASQLKVTFNNAVNATSAVKVANYALQNADGSTASSVYVGYAELAPSDPNSVILTLADSSSTPTIPATFSDLTKAYKVAVLNDVSTSAAKAFTTALTGSVTVTDVNLPVVANVVAVGNTSVDVTFNKPVLYAGATDFGIKDSTGTTQGGTLSAAYKTGSDFKTIRVTTQTGHSLPAGNYTIQVIGSNGTTDVHDTAGFVFATANQSFAVTTATTATQVSTITSLSQTQLDVVFSAPVIFTNGALMTWSSDGITYKAGDAAVVKVSDTEYKVNFTTNVIPAGNVTVKLSGLSDFNGQSVLAASQSVAVTANTIAALSGNVVETSDKVLTLTFTQPLDTTTATTASTYTLTNSSSVAVSGVVATLDATKKIVTLTYPSSITAGAYTLTITGLKDAVANTVTVTPQSLSLASTTKVDVTLVTATNAGTAIVVSYPVAMATSGSNSITNASNYQYSAVAGPAVYGNLPTGTTLVASADAKSVTITLPTGTTVTPGTSTIQVGNSTNTGFNVVADAYGNIQSVATEAVAIVADTAPSIATVAPKVTGANTIVIQPNHKLASVSASDFKYTINATAGTPVWTTPASVSLVTIGGNQYIQITTASTDTISSLTSDANVKVQTVATPSGSKTALGTEITGGITSAAASSSSFGASISAVEVKDASHVEVYLAGKATALTAGDLRLYQNGTLFGGTITPALLGTNSAGSVFELTLGVSTIDPTVAVTLKTLSQDLIGTTDQNGSYLTANSTGVTGSPMLMVTTLAQNTAAATAFTSGTSTVTLTFNRNVNPGTVISGWDGTATPTVDVKVDTTGKMTIAGIGTITGFTAPATLEDYSTSTVALSVGNTLTITLNGVAVPATMTPAALSSIVFTANSALQSTAATPVSTKLVTLKTY